MVQDKEISNTGQEKFASMAAGDMSAMVRVYLASALKRLEPAQCWDILKNLSVHKEDLNAHNIPLMVWYALDPMVEVDAATAANIAIGSEWCRERGWQEV